MSRNRRILEIKIKNFRKQLKTVKKHLIYHPYLNLLSSYLFTNFINVNNITL